MANITSLTSFLFDFILELLSTFMLTINIVKVKLINATENCLQNILVCDNLFNQLNYSLSMPLPFG